MRNLVLLLFVMGMLAAYGWHVPDTVSSDVGLSTASRLHASISTAIVSSSSTIFPVSALTRPASGPAGVGTVTSVERSSLEVDTVTIHGTDVRFTLALIPDGTFTLGSPTDEPGREDDEGPQRTVTVQPFWMGTHEVTFEEFAVYRFREQDSDTAVGTAYNADAVTRPSTPYEDPAHGMGSLGFPATGMTQYAALQYARWLSAKTGEFYRLPTEAEWEYACRAGSTTSYSFGEDPAELDLYAWHFGNSDETFHEVGQKRPNEWGLYDMHGNVSEWTLDQYDPSFYASLPEESDSPWARPTSRHPRTVRGGAFDDDPDALRCADRLKSNLKWKRRDPQIPKSVWWNTDSQFVGFRLVRPANRPSAEEIEAFWALVLSG